MKITPKVLYQRIKGPFAEALHLDLSGLGIGALEGLECCPKLESLDLSRNCLEEMENFECCKNLWRIDLSNNKLSCLDNLSKMFAIGTLDLSNNRLSWKDLMRIRNVCILDLRLHGNEKLESDTYYRLHVVDCLPNVWMLDGRLITAAERLQVQQFFQDSALSNRPVRHKFHENIYLYSAASRSDKIHGTRTYHFSANFGTNEPHNSDTDKRRLEFLAYNIQEDLKVRKQSTKHDSSCIHDNCLQVIIKNRSEDKEKSNMLLLLLIASVEFNLPESLIKPTLKTTKLNPLFGTDVLQLFLLDASSRIDVISLLVSCCKLDRDVKPISKCSISSGGLYDRLYLCLYHSVSHLVKRMSRIKMKNKNLPEWFHGKLEINRFQRPNTAPANQKYTRDVQSSSQKKQSLEWKSHQTLLASELVLLLSIVPSFYHHISENNESVCKVLSLATGDDQLFTRLAQLSHELTLHGGDINTLYREICRSVIKRIQMVATGSTSQSTTTNTQLVMKSNSKTKQTQYILNTSNAYPRRPKSSVLTSGERLTTGKRSQQITQSNPAYINMIKPYDLLHLTLGSLVLLGPQNLAKVIALPEQHIALVQMDLIPGANGSVTIQTSNVDEHFCYVDVRKLKYDYQGRYWKPCGAVGDKVTLQIPEDFAETSITPVVQKPLASQAYDVNESDTLTNKRDLMMFSSRAKEHPGDGSPSPSPRSQSMTTAIRIYTGDDNGEATDDETILHPLSTMFCQKMDLTLSETSFRRETLSRSSKNQQGRDYKDASDYEDRNFSLTFITEPRSQRSMGSTSEHDDRGRRRQTVPKPKPRRKRKQKQKRDTWHGEAADSTPIDAEAYLEQTARDEEEEESSDLNEQPPMQEMKVEFQRRSSKSSEDDRRSAKTSSPPTPVNISVPSINVDPRGAVGSEDSNEDSDQFEDASSEIEFKEDYVTEEEAGKDAENDVEPELQILMIKQEELLPVQEDSADEKEVIEFTLDGSRAQSRQPTSVRRFRVQSAHVGHSKTKPFTSVVMRPRSAVLPQGKRMAMYERELDYELSRPGSASSFQLERTEAWRSSTSSASGGFIDIVKGRGVGRYTEFVVDKNQLRRIPKVKFHMAVKRPPPQRPTSPDHFSPAIEALDAAGTDFILASRPNTAQSYPRSENGRVMTSNWLANGRDVHQEDFYNRRLITSPKLPGYLEGVNFLPKKLNTDEKLILNTNKALQMLPARTSRAFYRLPSAAYKKNFAAERSEAATMLDGSYLRNRPRFSSLNTIKKLSSRPPSRSARR